MYGLTSIPSSDLTAIHVFPRNENITYYALMFKSAAAANEAFKKFTTLNASLHPLTILCKVTPQDVDLIQELDQWIENLSQQYSFRKCTYSKGVISEEPSPIVRALLEKRNEFFWKTIKSVTSYVSSSLSLIHMLTTVDPRERFSPISAESLPPSNKPDSPLPIRDFASKDDSDDLYS